MTLTQEKISRIVKAAYLADNSHYTDSDGGMYVAKIAIKIAFSTSATQSEVDAMITAGWLTATTRPLGNGVKHTTLLLTDLAVIDAALDATNAAAGALAAEQQEITLNARVATTDNTLTTLYTFAVPNNTVYTIHATVLAKRTGGSAGSAGDALLWTFLGLLSNVAGTVSIIDTPDTVLKRSVTSSQTTWIVTPSVSGANALVKVKGPVNNNIDWQLIAKVVNIT